MPVQLRPDAGVVDPVADADDQPAQQCPDRSVSCRIGSTSAPPTARRRTAAVAPRRSAAPPSGPRPPPAASCGCAAGGTPRRWAGACPSRPCSFSTRRKLREHVGAPGRAKAVLDASPPCVLVDGGAGEEQLQAGIAAEDLVDELLQFAERPRRPGPRSAARTAPRRRRARPARLVVHHRGVADLDLWLGSCGGCLQVALARRGGGAELRREPRSIRARWSSGQLLA